MWNDLRDVLAEAARRLSRHFRDLAVTDLAFRAIAFAVLSPLAALLLRLAMSSTDRGALADVDIARFFITTRVGLGALLAVSTITVAIVTLETACLMAVGLCGARGSRLAPVRALAFAGTRAAHVLALAGHMVLRVLVGLLPFLLAAGAVYALLLREHDINYYLAEKPPAFWAAVALVGAIGAALAALLVRTIARWSVALPLVLFEGVPPRRALGESARRTRGRRAAVVLALAAWAAFALAAAGLGAALVDVLGRAIAPLLADRLGTLLLFVTLLVVLYVVLGIGVAIVNASLFALVLLGLYERCGQPSPTWVAAAAEPRAAGRLSNRARVVVGTTLVLAGAGVALLGFLATRGERDVAIIAHRGSSKEAPENSLSAFRLAIDQGADYVELDVQESADGVVVVNHDLDLMKIGGSPLKVFATSYDELRGVPIGRRAAPAYADERLPTLADALALCKGKAKVIVELKSYGHDERLEERVAELVEAAGMEQDVAFMSLDLAMAARMKKLRPGWRVGILVAKAIGDLNTVQADFLAVEARMATPRFVRRAHRAGHQVYVWTVDDPAWMLTMTGRGVDGLITNVPAVAREVLARRQAMSDAQRFLVALMIRLGARTETLEAESALRP